MFVNGRMRYVKTRICEEALAFGIDGRIELFEAIELAKYLSMPDALDATAVKPEVLAVDR